MNKNFIFLILSLFLFACSLSEKEKKTISDLTDQLPVQEAFNVTYLYSDSAVLQAKLTAPHVLEITENEVQFSIFDQGLKLEFFAKNGEPQSVLTGNNGRINMEKGLAKVTGNVLVINQKGERLETESLTWNKGADKVYSDEFVKIITEEEIVYGDSLEASPDFGQYKIFQIRGITNLKEN